MTVSWQEIVGSEAWESFWESDPLRAKRAALLSLLENPQTTDPHLLGLIRGQLKAQAELRDLGEKMAEAERKSHGGEAEEEHPPARIARTLFGRRVR